MSNSNPPKKPSRKPATRSTSTGTIAVANKGEEGRHVAVWRPSGRMVPKLSPEDIDYALERIGGGDHPDQVARHLGVTLRAFEDRERADPEFAKAYAAALASGSATNLFEADRALIEAGDVRKRADMAMWRAERLDKRFAAKSLISAESVTIQFNRGVDDDWDAGE